MQAAPIALQELRDNDRPDESWLLPGLRRDGRNKSGCTGCVPDSRTIRHPVPAGRNNQRRHRPQDAVPGPKEIRLRGRRRPSQGLVLLVEGRLSSYWQRDVFYYVYNYRRTLGMTYFHSEGFVEIAKMFFKRPKM